MAQRLTEPIVRLLIKTHITPNTLTWLGFSIALGAAAVIATGYPFVAGFIVLAAGFFDILDGALARRTGKVTRFGAILDSTLDRVSEAVLLLGILIFYLLWREQPTLGILLIGLALFASPLVSYLRAKGEALGLECQVGVFTRAERVIALAVGLWLSRVSDYGLIISLAVIVGFSFATAGQRLLYLKRKTRNS
jgi:CDP-diacylglycerol--glycerol-3-phosphate 3-phosphatidyltransferase